MDELEDIGEQLALKEVNALQAVHESWKEVISNIVEYPSKQDVEDCMGINKNVKAQDE